MSEIRKSRNLSARYSKNNILHVPVSFNDSCVSHRDDLVTFRKEISIMDAVRCGRM